MPARLNIPPNKTPCLWPAFLDQKCIIRRHYISYLYIYINYINYIFDRISAPLIAGIEERWNAGWTDHEHVKMAWTRARSLNKILLGAIGSRGEPRFCFCLKLLDRYNNNKWIDWRPVASLLSLSKIWQLLRPPWCKHRCMPARLNIPPNKTPCLWPAFLDQKCIIRRHYISYLYIWWFVQMMICSNWWFVQDWFVQDWFVQWWFNKSLMIQQMMICSNWWFVQWFVQDW